jgi:type VI secretion system protein ImpC
MRETRVNNPGQHSSEVLDLTSLGSALTREFKPRNEISRVLVENAVRVLAQQALSNQNVIQEDAIKTIQAVIAALDAKLTEQLNEIIHQADFQALESTWRGLHYLVSNSETSSKLKIRVMDISKSELNRTLRNYRGAMWDQSPIFKRIYEEEFGQLGGEPFGCIIGDYYFDHSMPDIELLTGLSRIAASAHCPFIAAASPDLMQMDDWADLGNPVDLAKIFTTPDYAAWNSLRQSSDSRYLALTLPRFASRAPYGPRSEPLDAFPFEEDLSRGAQDVLWSNAAFAMAVNINRAYVKHGWCSQIRGIESGGVVQNLPMLRYAAHDAYEGLGIPTETTISDRREAELSRAGFMPLVYRKNSDIAVFVGARSVHLPKIYDNKEANENSELSARLPYLFAVSRFAHYLKFIARDKVGSFASRQDLQRWMNDWVMRYVDGDPSISSEDVKAKRPLAQAEVLVEELPGEPGYYHTTFFLRPHFQLEGLSVSLRLVGKIPSNDQAQISTG